MLHLKSFPVRFKGDRPRWTLIATLDAEKSNSLARLLAWFDMVRLGPQKGREADEATNRTFTWASRSSLQRPDDAILMLRDRGVPLAKTASVAVADLSARDGAPTLKVRAETHEVLPGQRGRVVFHADPAEGVVIAPDLVENRERILKNCGWLRTPPMLAGRESEFLSAHGLYTVDPAVAAPLLRFMSPEVRKIWQAASASMAKTRALSSASTTPEGVSALRAQLDPPPEARDLAPFQAFGVVEAARRKAMLLADDMGLGKTVQAIYAARLAGAKTILVICQANNKINWKREWEYWTGESPDLIGVAEGSKLPETPILIINQDILVRHAEALTRRRFDRLIVDEAHNFNNPDARRSQALDGVVGWDFPTSDGAANLLSSVGGTVFLTGTPMPNGPRNWWGLGKMADPLRWGVRRQDWEAFEDRYCDPTYMEVEVTDPRTGRSRTQVVRNIAKGGRRLYELQNSLRSTIMVRRMKTDPAIASQLPPKRRLVYALPVKLTEKLREMLCTASEAFKMEAGGAIDEALTAFEDAEDEEELWQDLVPPAPIREAAPAADQAPMTVRHAAPAVGYEEAAKLSGGGARRNRVSFTDYSRVRHNLAIFKAPLIAPIIADDLIVNDDKAVVFVRHRAAIEEIVRVVNERLREADEASGSTRRRRAVVYHGGISRTRRQQAIDDFQNDPDTVCFVGSFGAAATAITLTAGARLEIVEFHPRPDIMIQAEDRAWRLGQLSSVLVRIFAIADSPEVNDAQNLTSKMAKIEKSVGSKLSQTVDITAALAGPPPSSMPEPAGPSSLDLVQ